MMPSSQLRRFADSILDDYPGKARRGSRSRRHELSLALSPGWQESFRELLAEGVHPAGPAWAGFRALRPARPGR
jgi:hypothetical protein